MHIDETGYILKSVHPVVPYETKLGSQWTDLAENRRVTSSSNHMATLKEVNISDFPTSFTPKLESMYILQFLMKQKVRNQWTDLAENRAVSSYSNHIATL